MFIPYLGEKSKFSNFIIPNIPTDISTYVEPFGGMFGIFFCLDLNQFKGVNFIYNDYNWLNYNLFSYLKDPQFINLLDELKPTEESYNRIKSELLNNNWSEQDAALNWLTVLCCSASQHDILNATYKGNGELEVFKMKLKFGKNRISKISNIYNLDYSQVISKWDSESTFFYLDPPYKNLEHYYINHNFNHQSHSDLAEILNGIKGRFALSYFNFPELEQWYPDCRIIKQRTLMGTELLIMNY